jgi:predicted helicase
MNFSTLLDTYRKESRSEREKGSRFERLMQLYLLTDPYYASRFTKVWMWNEFPFRKDLGGQDTGIDLVAQTTHGAYWAIQCKCYQETTTINKGEVDSFLTTAGRAFTDENNRSCRFEHCLWISTTNRWGTNAEEAIRNHVPAVSRIPLYHLQNSSVDWAKLEQGMSGEQSRKPHHTPMEHQRKAIDAAKAYYQTADRGKLIMACGTGKTFTSLKIAEELTGSKGVVLFLVPSIALLGQTLEEWTANSSQPINAICICSDPEVSKKKSKNEDVDTFSIVDLALPASTDTPTILKQLNEASGNAGMTVVFSTYQSIEVIAKAQKAYQKEQGADKGIFDLIICDEAHRTTGVTLSNEDESAFVKVHNNDFIAGRRRMYMTATPRLYHDDAKKKAVDNDMVLCSMDDAKLYGEEFYHIGFGEAVDKGLLSDYKVLILTVNEQEMTEAAQEMVKRGETEIPADDINKLIGCINALSKEIIGDQGTVRSIDPKPMTTAVAFCSSINGGKRGTSQGSKQITNTFNQMGELYYKTLPTKQRGKMVQVESRHIDGTMAATTRGELLTWLKAPKNEMQCRILTNVRCLSEGVDVPSLDAVMFLSARNSQVDVVQSVGRVMRTAPGKKFGYIIIPIVVPSDVQGEKALSNSKEYEVVWTVLNALRAHDERFKATINQIELNKNKPASIVIGGAAHGKSDDDRGTETVGTDVHQEQALQLAIGFDKMQTLLYAKMVEKVGTKPYWEQWARDVADIAIRQKGKIKQLVEIDKKHQRTFEHFIKGLRKNINPSISEEDAIEMLAQHLITQPVFESLFENYSFVHSNVISQSMEQMLALLEEQKDEKDADTLQRFYDSVRVRVSKIDNAEAKQKIIIELYDKFFKTAFPKMVEQLGIVYTPVEVVDYIIRSVDAVLRKEFDRTLSDENLHILDPFTGTGTFITRLLQSGLIRPEDLPRKYTHEIHANEIVLLAYYIASVNIENVYHDLMKAGDGAYTPFDGICLTDTFQLGETKAGEDLFSDMFPQNSKRVEVQQKAPMMVIMGNPPYSIGQKSANDNAQNQSYPNLEERIENTYVKESTATFVKSIYDAYIKAFRWSSDRLGDNGVIAFITNGMWIDANASDGFRKCLNEEFNTIYVFNLRGSIRGRKGDSARKEGQNVFDIMTGVAITILVKNAQHKGCSTIHYHDIGQYLSRRDKLNIINKFGSLENPDMQWEILQPNEHNDWINRRDEGFDEFIPLAPEKKFDKNTESVFTANMIAISTNRDAWAYNFSKKAIYRNMSRMIDFYNNQCKDYHEEIKTNLGLVIEDFIDTDKTKISWTVNLKKDINKGVRHALAVDAEKESLYRPYTKEWLYYDASFIERPGLSLTLFPTNNAKNLVICVPTTGSRFDFTPLVCNVLPDLHIASDGTQCFPLYWYEKVEAVKNKQLDMFEMAAEQQEDYYARRDGISDFILEQARKLYGNKTTKEDVFYYVYAFLHNPTYREQFSSDLKKQLPRIPLMDDSVDFWKYVKAGRELADLHLHYEDHADEFPVTVESANYEVTKMRFPSKDDKSRIIYNPFITISDIPTAAYEYVVNGKSAIEWVMERYQVITNKDSGIVNDPNDWAREHDQPRYIFDLLRSVIAISVKTVEIVKNLPKVKF